MATITNAAHPIPLQEINSEIQNIVHFFSGMIITGISVNPRMKMIIMKRSIVA